MGDGGEECKGAALVGWCGVALPAALRGVNHCVSHPIYVPPSAPTPCTIPEADNILKQGQAIPYRSLYDLIVVGRFAQLGGPATPKLNIQGRQV